MSVKTAYRGLDKLDPRTRKKVELAMQEIKESYGDSVFITETWRSEARQKHLRAQGFSKVKRSKHQDWLAVDIAFKDDKRTVQIEKVLYPRDYAKRREIADVFKKYWMDWWYDLWNWDKPHFQDDGKKLVVRKWKKIEDRDIVESLHALVRVSYTQCKNTETKNLLSKVSKIMRDSWVSSY